MFGGPQLAFNTGWSDASKTTIGAFDVLCSRELVWVDQRTSSAPVEPMTLRRMHRCNDASLDTVSEPPTAIIWTQRDRLNRCLQFLTRRFFRWSRFFCSGLPTAMWPSPLYIRAPLAHLNCLWRIQYLRPPKRRRQSEIEQWIEDLVQESDPNLKKSSISWVASVLGLGPA